jgi:hypothetical protein
MEVVAGAVVAVFDAMNTPVRARPDGQGPARELDETACAVHPRPRRRGWRRVATAAAAAEPPVPVLDWQPCAAPSQHGFDCATAQVPLDYGDPERRTIELVVIKREATDPGQRLGTLFFNPGGPGGSGTAQLPQWYEESFAQATLNSSTILILLDDHK